MDLMVEVPVDTKDVERLWRVSAGGEEAAASVLARVAAARGDPG